MGQGLKVIIVFVDYFCDVVIINLFNISENVLPCFSLRKIVHVNNLHSPGTPFVRLFLHLRIILKCIFHNS